MSNGTQLLMEKYNHGRKATLSGILITELGSSKLNSYQYIGTIC
jgi:hypothetical protein